MKYNILVGRLARGGGHEHVVAAGRPGALHLRMGAAYDVYHSYDVLMCLQYVYITLSMCNMCISL